jgi:ligand-binding SRPBCC domain-containing protein
MPASLRGGALKATLPLDRIFLDHPMSDIQFYRQADGAFLLECKQHVQCKLEDVFDFFADANNLEALTPAWLSFRILGSSTPKIQAGTTLDYRLSVHGLPLRWRSLITTWNPPFEFVDEQLSGPYRSWIHQHLFEETERGVLVTDRVRYKVFGGALTERLLVRRDLRRIFRFRSETLAELAPRLASFRDRVCIEAY